MNERESTELLKSQRLAAKAIYNAGVDLESVREQLALNLAKHEKNYGLTNNLTQISQSVASVKQYTSNLARSIATFQESFKDFAPAFIYTMNRLPDAMKELSDGGWFFDYDTTPGIVVGLADKLSNGQKLDVDQTMVQYYQENLEGILGIISKRHSERIHIIDEVRLCYNNQMYYAGITTILSQIDGICNQYTNSDMFRSKDKKPKVYNSLTANSKKPDNFLLSPIRQNPAISKNEEFQIPGELNRHLVMHGKDIQYGTQLNFFKSLSLLKYLSDVLYFWSMEGDVT